jgi:hypothetical protein
MFSQVQTVTLKLTCQNVLLKMNNNKLDLPKAELQLALSNTNPEVTISLLNEFPQQLLTPEQNATDNTSTLPSIYIRNYEMCSFMLRQIEQVMPTNL